MDKDSPAVKMLMRYPRMWLVHKCQELGLKDNGYTKIVLALRIAEYESERSCRDWDVISGG
jgi:hypothetical protein